MATSRRCPEDLLAEIADLRNRLFREKTIVKLLAEGKTPKEIADLLYISVFTVRRHRDNIMQKLNLTRLADLIRYALSRGITAGLP